MCPTNHKGARRDQRIEGTLQEEGERGGSHTVLKEMEENRKGSCLVTTEDA